MIELLSEYYHRLFNIKITNKCIAYIDDKKGVDKIVDAFEIEEYSFRRAYNTAYEVINLKYTGLGIDLRIIEKK